jgi:hypothetical protein
MCAFSNPTEPEHQSEKQTNNKKTHHRRPFFNTTHLPFGQVENSFKSSLCMVSDEKQNKTQQQNSPQMIARNVPLTNKRFAREAWPKNITINATVSTNKYTTNRSRFLSRPS